MSRRSRFLLVIAAGGFILPAVSSSRAFETARQVTVAGLVDQLSASELQARVDAERQLRELGAEALAALPDPRTLSPVAAEAVKRIRTHLERQQVRTALQASRVTLSDRLSLADALVAVAEQTGNRLDGSALPESNQEQLLSFDLEDVPFWEAVQVIEQQAAVVAESTAARDALTFRVRREDDHAPSSSLVTGPFRVSVDRTEVRSNLTQPGRHLLRFTLSLAVEPRLRPLFVSVAAADVAVTEVAATAGDVAVRTFPPFSPVARREIPVDRPGPIVMTHDVILPRAVAEELPIAVNVRGSLMVEVAAGRERFDFRHVDENGPVTRRHGGVSVTLDDVRHADGELNAALRIAYEADGPRFESHRSWVFHNDVSLTLSDEITIVPAEFETLEEGEGGVRLRYRFADIPAIAADTELSYTAPTLITRVPVEFVFEGVTIEGEAKSE